MGRTKKSPQQQQQLGVLLDLSAITAGKKKSARARVHWAIIQTRDMFDCSSGSAVLTPMSSNQDMPIIISTISQFLQIFIKKYYCLALRELRFIKMIS